MLKKSKRHIRAVVTHCTATPPNRKVTMGDIYRWHVTDNGWSAPGYHVLILRDGSYELGRDIDRNGAHAATNGYNRNSIGVALAGGLSHDLRPAPEFTRAQWRTYDRLIAHLKGQYPDAEFIGHRDTGANKACPSFDVRRYLRTGEVKL